MPVVRCAGRSGFDETIRLLAQAERLLGEAEEICALATNAAFLSRRLDDTAINDLSPEVPAIDGEAEHRLVHVLELGDGELRRQQLEAERRVSDLAPQPADRVINDLAMVECHLHREPSDRVPFLLSTVLAARRFTSRGLGVRSTIPCFILSQSEASAGRRESRAGGGLPGRPKGLRSPRSRPAGCAARARRWYLQAHVRARTIRLPDPPAR